MACFALFLIVSSQEPDSSTHPHLRLPTCDSWKGVPVEETSADES